MAGETPVQFIMFIIKPIIFIDRTKSMTLGVMNFWQLAVGAATASAMVGLGQFGCVGRGERGC